MSQLAPVRNGDVGDWRLSDDIFLDTFRLPSAADRCEVLALRNPIPGEERIAFDELTHVYTVDGVVVPRSVTGLLHTFSDEFNACEAIDAMQRGRDWELKRECYLREDGQLMTSDEIAGKFALNGAV